jgi:hypothetical protein
MISNPDTSSFKHVSHLGYDQDKGAFQYDSLPPELKEIFANAGVTERELADPKIAKFINEFLQSQEETITALKKQKGEPTGEGPVGCVQPVTAFISIHALFSLSTLSQLRPPPPPPLATTTHQRH